MKAFPLTAILLFFLLVLLQTPAAAEKLEIDRESDGIHIIQKRTPKKAPPPKEDDATAAEGDEEAEAPSSPRQEQQTPPKEQVPLDENPEYIKELNKLTDAYNRRVENLQRERNRLSNRFNQRAGQLRQQVLSTEQAMALAEQNYERQRFEQLQQRRLELLRRLQRLETNWQETQTELRQRELDLEQDYEQAKQELRTRYQKKQPDRS